MQLVDQDHRGRDQMAAASAPSPQALWMALILSGDLQMPLHDQSKDAAHTFPACFFHSQSAVRASIKSQNQHVQRAAPAAACMGSAGVARSGGQCKKLLCTWRRGAAEAAVVDVLDLQPEEPGAERHVLVREPVQDRPARRSAARKHTRTHMVGRRRRRHAPNGRDDAADT